MAAAGRTGRSKGGGAAAAAAAAAAELCALRGEGGGEQLLTFRGVVAGRQVKVLVDSGAGRNFLDAEFAERCGLRLTPNAFEVTLAGGQRSRSAGTYCGAFRLGGDGPEGIEGEVEFVVTSLRGAACDAVLGFPFLRQLNPYVDWRARTLAFGREGKGKGMGMGKGKAAGRVLLRAEGKVITVAGGYAAPLAATAAQTPIHADDKRIVDLLVGDFRDVFPDALPAGLPPSRGGIVHEIELISGARPHKQPVYRQSEVELKEMRKQLDEKLAKGFIGYSKSPYAAAAMLVPKPDGGWRFVVDYRALNKDTVKNSYALPLADELFDRVQGAQVFSKIDLRTGFYQIPLKEEDCWKTGFGTTFGHFEYRVLPMGLTNSPATFMHLMNHTFSDMTGPGGCVLVFLDDIVIYSRDREQHRKDVRAVLERLRANKLYAKMSKCSFFQREVEFLGHRLGADGVKVIQGKVEAIKQWPTPTSVKDVRSFLGLAGYYRRFVQGFGKIAAPLHELTKDDPDAAAKGKGKGKGRGDGRRKQRGHFSWGPEQQRAFDALKAALQSAPVLLIPNPKLPFVLSTDASGEAIGAVLQQDPTGHGLQPVGYYSRKLTPAERNYAVRDKELAAVIAALDHWRHLLHSGRKFVIRTDHQSLRHLMSQPRLTGRPARWLLKLEEFDFDVEYVKGPANAVADALSRNVATGAGEGRAKLSAAEMAELRSRARKAEEEGDEAVAALEARLARADSGREARRRGDKSGPPARLVNVRAQLLRDEGGEERRREAEAAAQEVRPAEAYAVPPPDPDAAGNRQMATQRCAAMTRKGQGRQCRQLTRIGCLCWNHLARDAGLRVKRSTVPGAGRGLFAERDLEAGADLGVYSGLEVSGPEALRGDRSGAYALEVKRGLLIDAAPTNAAVTRFANDARGTSKRPNAAFRRNPRTGEVHLKATRRIRRGEEVLVSYGPAYWRPLAAAQRQAEVSAAQPQARARADADAAAIERPRKRKSGRGGQKARAGVFLQVRQTTAREHGRERGAREAAWRPETKYDEGAQQRRRPAELQLFALSIQGGGDDLEAAIREAGEEDDGYQELLQRPRAPVFSVERGLLYWRGRVVVPDSEELRTRVLEWCHERPEAGHLGRDKLLAELQRRFYWRGMTAAAARFVRSCHTCQAVKDSQQAKPGLTLSLPVPDEPWQSVSLDLIGPLPRTRHGHNAIVVFVDRLTKMAHFASTTMEVTAPQLAELFLREVVRLHGFPRDIVSDRDPRFTAGYWEQFWKALGARLSMSTAYHPQTDGQTERTNKTLESILRAYVSWKLNDWDQHLTMAELAYNSAPQASTRYSPFYLNYGREATKPIDLALRNIRARGQQGDSAADVSNAAAADRLKELAEALVRAQNNVAQAQRRQALYADRGRRPASFAVGDWVMLSTKHLKEQGRDSQAGVAKLGAKWTGPFKVKGSPNANAYTLELPGHMRIHPTVNIDQLKPYWDGGAEFRSRVRQEQSRPAAVYTEDNGAEVFEVEAIRAARANPRKRRREWLVKWKGWPEAENTWEPAENLAGSEGLLREFEAQQQEERRDSRAGRRRSPRLAEVEQGA